MSKTFTLLLVHAHPDDECSGTGGLIAKSARAGHRVVLITCTNGEMGETKHLGLDAKVEADRERLGAARCEELAQAARILGVAHLHPLGYRDSGMEGWEGNGDPRAFMNAEEGEVVGKLVAHLRRYRPEVVITYNEGGGYGHPDHVMANKATTKALEAAADPAFYPEAGEAWRTPKFYHTAWARSRMMRTWRWMRFFGRKTPLDDPDFREDKYGTPDEVITTRVNVGKHLRRKWRALNAHKSQITGNFFWWFIRLTGRWLYEEETFVRVRSDVETPEEERSVFDGLS